MKGLFRVEEEEGVRLAVGQVWLWLARDDSYGIYRKIVELDRATSDIQMEVVGHYKKESESFKKGSVDRAVTLTHCLTDSNGFWRMQPMVDVQFDLW